MDVSVPLQVCDSLASSSVLEDRGHTRSSGESIGVLCPHPLAVTVIWCVLMSFFASLLLSDYFVFFQFPDMYQALNVECCSMQYIFRKVERDTSNY